MTGQSKKQLGKKVSGGNTLAEDVAPLLGALRQIISDSRQQVLRSVDVVQVQTYWHVGQHILEFEQGGAQRAAYGQRLLPQLGQALSAEFGRGFDATNLRHMRGFYQAFPIRDALRRELSWTHYRLLLRVNSDEARQWYVQEAAAQNWSTRALERQIGSLYYERLLLSQDKAAVTVEAQTNLAALDQSPRAFVRDPVMLEFLGLADTGRLLEAKLETALMDKLQHFLMELGKGFAFVARQQRISTETQDFYIDLVFYNYLLKCFVLIDLKTGPLTHQDVGQMDMYVRMYDDLRRGEDDNPTVGILLCGSKDKSVVRYSVLNGSEQLFASKYRLVLPSEEDLRLELQRDREEIEAHQDLRGEGNDGSKT
ncbi:PDDEXK nuclease domain-containing protein [Rhodoferax ferrireducens]|uniref:PDDEXK nuclease domain-containing protein n=1 Tax=Rhodoferax ferrireducens TaxID=192843 RepID=UPI000E0D26AC|nr:PDDEXK nuclease domain-containing protein [Rhodoferax ferrireducens]